MFSQRSAFQLGSWLLGYLPGWKWLLSCSSLDWLDCINTFTGLLSSWLQSRYFISRQQSKSFFARLRHNFRYALCKLFVLKMLRFLDFMLNSSTARCWSVRGCFQAQWFHKLYSRKCSHWSCKYYCLQWSFSLLLMMNIVSTCRLTLDERVAIASSVGEEVLQEAELRNLLEKKKTDIVAYDGFEPSGRMHIAQASELSHTKIGCFVGIDLNLSLSG